MPRSGMPLLIFFGGGNKCVFLYGMLGVDDLVFVFTQHN